MGVSRAAVIATMVVVGLSAMIRGQAPSGVPDFAAQEQHLAELAVEAARRPTVDPIPLRSGDRVVGAIYDHFLLGVIVARAAISAGRPVDAALVLASPQWRAHQMVVVALPVDCDGRPDHPLAIRFVPAMAPPIPMPAAPAPMRGDAAAALLPGVDLPADALVAPSPTLPLANARVDVDYVAAVCHGALTTASFPLAATPLILSGLNGVKLPQEFASLPSPSAVRVFGIVDLDGHFRFAQVVQGPAELGPAALALVNGRPPSPWLTNGVPTTMSLMTSVVFTSTGAPAVVPRPAPPPGAVTTSTRVFVPTAARSAPGPPVPAALAEANLKRLAIDVASAGPAAPLSLDADGSYLHGMLFDRFIMQVVQAHEAAATGAAPNVQLDPAALDVQDAIVVAAPINCGHPVAPTAIQMFTGQASLQPARGAMSGQVLRDRLPGVTIPDGAVGQAFVTAPLVAGVTVQITYAEPACPSGTNVVSLPLQVIPSQPINRPTDLKLPEGSTLPSPTTVHVRGVIDLTGAVRYLSVADGPAELQAAALTAGSQWRFLPFRVNGTPVPQTVSLAIAFGSPSAPPTDPARIASSTVGGRSTEDERTADEPGLSATTSRCAIATDATYGFAAANPIKVGGDWRIGPSRERAYLGALRGPAGEGLHFVRLGSTMGPDRQTILDLYEITYAGIAQAIRLYVDEYHLEDLKAPAGFVCAAPFNIK
jgi:hypothetical protein